MRIIRKGCTRIVLLTKNKAIKIPNFTYSLNHFLKGWLANLQEETVWRVFNTKGLDKGDKLVKYLCPVEKTYFWKFIVIMPKCSPIVDINDFPEESPIGNICGDYKIENYGYLNKQLVCFDYGQ